jgi:hypothetical protein
MAEINLKKLTAGVSDIDVNFNSTLEGQADTTIPINVNLTDGVNPVAPTSVALTGNDLDITIVPSGVLFKTVEPSQYTSFRTGDEGWRVQNGFFDYTPPTNPAAFAELDYSIGANYFFKLKNPLTVNGVSSTERFVDINGVQSFTVTGNANLVLIDKLTGMMITRTTLTGGDWNNCIDTALTHSIVVNSITYDDWYLISLSESLNIFGTFFRNIFSDPISSNQIFNIANNTYFSSTTNIGTTTFSQSVTIAPSTIDYSNTTKILSRAKIFITNARNLITAP